MKTRYLLRGIKFVLGITALCALVVSVQATVLIDELFETGYNRTVNNIGNSNMAWFKGRINQTATVNVGSLNFTGTGSGSTANWGYFTDPTQNLLTDALGGSQVSNGHLLLNVGDTLIASMTFNLSTVPSTTSTFEARVGLFDNPVGTRSMQDFNGGMTSTAFTNNPGFAVFVPLMNVTTADQVSIRKHTLMATQNVFNNSGDYQQIDGLVGGTYNPMMDLTNYTLSFSVSHEATAVWVLRASIKDATTGGVVQDGTVVLNDASVPGSFSLLAMRYPNDSAPGAGGITYNELKVEVIPEPSTLMLAGTGLALAVLAIRRRR